MMMMRLLLIGLMLPCLAWAQTGDISISGSPDNTPVLSNEAVEHSFQRGDFRITFPSGCGKMVIKYPNDLPDVDGRPAVQINIAYCDRFEKKGEGCSVVSYFNVTDVDGGYPGSDQVIERVVELLKTMGVAIKRQEPIHKELSDGSIIEGIDIYAAEANGIGQARLRGLLYNGDIYVVSAWKSTGGLWDDQEYIFFFNSFKPGAY